MWYRETSKVWACGIYQELNFIQSKHILIEINLEINVRIVCSFAWNGFYIIPNNEKGTRTALMTLVCPVHFHFEQHFVLVSTGSNIDHFEQMSPHWFSFIVHFQQLPQYLNSRPYSLTHSQPVLRFYTPWKH